jgi:hypothetical protein
LQKSNATPYSDSHSYYHPKHITVRLNDYFSRTGIDIRCVNRV